MGPEATALLDLCNSFYFEVLPCLTALPYRLPCSVVGPRYGYPVPGTALPFFVFASLFLAFLALVFSFYSPGFAFRAVSGFASGSYPLSVCHGVITSLPTQGSAPGQPELQLSSRALKPLLCWIYISFYF